MMGRGGYLGGGTIIRPGSGWFSNDSRREDPPPSRKSKLFASRHSDGSAIIKPAKRKKSKVDEKTLWLNFVVAVVAAELQHRSPPNPPHQIRADILRIAAELGGISAWVKRHPEYPNVLARLRKKYGAGDAALSHTSQAKLHPRQENARQSRPPSPPIRGMHPEIDALNKERDALLVRLAGLQDTVNGLEKEIHDVDGRIKFAVRLIAPTISMPRR